MTAVVSRTGSRPGNSEAAGGLLCGRPQGSKSGSQRRIRQVQRSPQTRRYGVALLGQGAGRHPALRPRASRASRAFNGHRIRGADLVGTPDSGTFKGPGSGRTPCSRPLDSAFPRLQHVTRIGRRRPE